MLYGRKLKLKQTLSGRQRVCPREFAERLTDQRFKSKNTHATRTAQLLEGFQILCGEGTLEPEAVTFRTSARRREVPETQQLALLELWLDTCCGWLSWQKSGARPDHRLHNLARTKKNAATVWRRGVAALSYKRPPAKGKTLSPIQSRSKPDVWEWQCYTCSEDLKQPALFNKVE